MCAIKLHIHYVVKVVPGPGVHFLHLVPCSAVEALLIRQSIVHAKQLPVHQFLDQSITYYNLTMQMLTSRIAVESLTMLSMISSIDALSPESLAGNVRSLSTPLT